MKPRDISSLSWNDVSNRKQRIPSSDKKIAKPCCRPDQKDSDSLPPYDVLDPILERYVELDQTPQQIAAAGFALETVKRVARMVDRNEYKRRQAAPGVRLSTRAFGRDRRFPITSRYDEQDPVPES